MKIMAANNRNTEQLARKVLHKLVSGYVRERTEYIENNIHHKLMDETDARREREILRRLEQLAGLKHT